MLTSLLKKLRVAGYDETSNWGTRSQTELVINLEARTVGPFQFGDALDAFRSLGRADKFLRHEGKRCSLLYGSLGLLLEFDEDRQLCYVSFLVDEDSRFPRCPGFAFARPVFASGITLSEASTESDLRSRFGKPKHEDLDDHEIVLTFAVTDSIWSANSPPAEHLRC